jgi:hypothetical protein
MLSGHAYDVEKQLLALANEKLDAKTIKVLALFLFAAFLSLFYSGHLRSSVRPEWI